MHVHIILEGVSMGGNTQEGNGEETLGACGDICTSDFQGRYPTGGARMGHNVPRPEREGVLSGHWEC